MRVALADDSALFRRGLALLFAEEGIDVVGDWSTGTELLHFLAADLPDAVVLDIRMPPTFSTEGLMTALEIRRRHPDVGVLVLSTYAETTYAVQLLQAGADRVGYLLKDRVDDPETLVDALVRLTNGECVIDPQIVARLLDRRQRRAALSPLTARERDVLRLMAEGRSNLGIGQKLFLSPKTVEAHVAAIFSKLGLAPGSDSNRRVRAVLTWLRAAGNGS